MKYFLTNNKTYLNTEEYQVTKTIIIIIIIMSASNVILIISGIKNNVSPEYIATVFAKHKIAQLKNVTLVPYFSGNIIYVRAYVEIWAWCENQVAYNFVKQLTNMERETFIRHNDDEYWTVELTQYGSESPFQTIGSMSQYFPITFDETCLDIESAEKRLDKAHRDLIFAREYGDDYDAQVKAEMAYSVALNIFKEVRCNTECTATNSERYKNVTLRSHQKNYFHL